MKKLILILSLLFFTTSVNAEHEGATYDLYWNQIPAVCGNPDEVSKYIKDNDLEPVHLSLGRQGSQPDGEPVYMITYYENAKGDQVLVTVDIPSASETCILFRSFNKTEVDIKPKSNT